MLSPHRSCSIAPGSPQVRSTARRVNLQRAVSAFQQVNGLPATAELDEATWQKLLTSTRNEPALVEYHHTGRRGRAVHTTIPADLAEQGNLKRLDYRNTLEELGERFHASPALLKRINPKRRSRGSASA